jgi:hypothetical protein
MKPSPQKLMKPFILAIILLAQTPFVFAQKPRSSGPGFDVVEFNKKFEVAQWLVRYDTVAWKTTDVLVTQDKAELDRLGQDWFCFEDEKGLWHAVYGKLENDKFDLVSHFVIDSGGKITRTTDKVESDFLVSHARALRTAREAQTKSIPEGSPSHNQYIKRNADKSFSVWLLPAFQPNGVAVYGGEFIYTIDPLGAKVTKDESYFQGKFRGFKTTPPREIWIDYHETEKPTLGGIFFVWYYKEYFTDIYLDTSRSTSTVVGNDKNGYIWVHVDKDKDKDKKPATPPISSSN